MRLAGGTNFLVLRRDDSFAGHSVAFHDSFPAALTAWTPGTRISPIYALDNATAPSLGPDERCWLLFAGPIHPERLDFGPPQNKFITLGLFNVLLVSASEEDAEVARKRVGLIGRCWEEWTLRGDRVVARQYSDRIAAVEPIPKAIRQVVKPSEEPLNEALREYSVMMATSIGRGAWFLPEAVDDLLRFDALFRRAYSSGRGDAVLKQGMVVQVNAALSRFSSQTFSGISPITETECHFWTHSLLGIGIASLALLTIRSHLLSVFSESRLIANILALKQRPSQPTDLAGLSAADPFWQEPHLERARPLMPAPTPEDSEIPQIVFFSGRDGFHSTSWSLSGPLELITSCNTTAWTMLTLTHEFAHFIVERLLGQLLPNPNAEVELVRIATVIKTSAPAELFEQLRAYLCFAMWTLTDQTTAQEPTPAILAQAISSQHGELDEILTSLVDFLYFYQGKEDTYIRSLWVSWGVIPNIQNRVTEYVIRCLCVLHLADYRRKDGAGASIDRLHFLLSQAKEDFPNALYIPDALRIVETQRSALDTALRRRGLYVKFAAAFLKSPTLLGIFDRERPAAGGERRRHSQELEFDTYRVDDPIAFLKTYSDETVANASKAVWMMQQLAFAELS